MNAWELKTPEEYVVTPKTDGVRFLLLISKNSAGRPFIAMVNRANEVFLLKGLKFRDSAYNGTLLDGEYLPAHGVYLVFDVVRSMGQSFLKSPFDARLQALNFAMKYNHMPSPEAEFRMEVKKFTPIGQLRHFVEVELPSYPYPCDGVIFMPRTLPIQIGRHMRIFKWKAPEDNTVDFRVRFEHGLPTLWGLTPIATEEHVSSDVLPLPPNMQSLHEKGELDGKVVECAWNSEVRGWRLQRIREDKTVPNDLLTISRTFATIEEHIQLEEIVRYMETSRLSM